MVAVLIGLAFSGSIPLDLYVHLFLFLWLTQIRPTLFFSLKKGWWDS